MELLNDTYFEWPLERIYYVRSFHFDSYRIKRYFTTRDLKMCTVENKIYIQSQNKFLSKYESSPLAANKGHVCIFLSELNTFKKVLCEPTLCMYLLFCTKRRLQSFLLKRNLYS